MSILNTNTRVTTPLGEGIVQGGYLLKDAQGQPVAQALLVRLPVNDVTRAHLNQANCITPRAQHSALFVFPTSEKS